MTPALTSSRVGNQPKKLYYDVEGTHRDQLFAQISAQRSSSGNGSSMSNPNAAPGQGSNPNLVSTAVNTDLKGLIHCHLPSFSYRHGMIPKLYVMPWKQDMKFRNMALKHAKLVELYTGPLEDSLFLEKCERHCHGEDRKQLLQKVPCRLTVEDIPIYSHLSRYHKSMMAYGFRIRL